MWMCACLLRTHFSTVYLREKFINYGLIVAIRIFVCFNCSKLVILLYFEFTYITCNLRIMKKAIYLIS